MEPSQHRPARRAALVCVAVLAAGAIVALVARNAWVRRSREKLLSQYEDGYLRVVEGMTQERVVELMGRPSEMVPAVKAEGAGFWADEPLTEDEAAAVKLCLCYWARPRSRPCYVFLLDKGGALVGKRRVR